jgi:hypothetical protein
MRLPEFTAETSLYRTKTQYRQLASGAWNNSEARVISQQITDWDYQLICVLGLLGYPYDYGADVTCCTDPCRCAYRECIYYGVTLGIEGDISNACGWWGDNCLVEPSSVGGGGGGGGVVGGPRGPRGPAKQ